METIELTITTDSAPAAVDLTAEVAAFIAGKITHPLRGSRPAKPVGGGWTPAA